jgi:hypothetical protein
MCRSIQPLHNYEPPTTPDEMRAASLQYVRKISGMTRPSHVNEAAFERAVEAVSAVTAELLAELVATTPPHDRSVERARRRARFELRESGRAAAAS